MSEMEWEEAPPAVSVPRVRPWLRRELLAWTRGCYPPRRGVTIVWGCLFIIPWAVWLLVKAFVWALGVTLMVAAYPFWVVAELLTYRRRKRRAALAQWGPYMGELHG